jgi:hypothetical protein
MTITKLLELLISKVESASNLEDLITDLYSKRDIDSYADSEKLFEIIEKSYLKMKYNNYNSTMIVGYLKKLLMQQKLDALNSLIEDTNINKIENNNGTEYDVTFTKNGTKYKIARMSEKTLFNTIRKEINELEDANLKNEKLYKLNQL